MLIVGKLSTRLTSSTLKIASAPFTITIEITAKTPNAPIIAILPLSPPNLS